MLLEETDDRRQSLIANFTEDVDLDAMVKAMFTWKVGVSNSSIYIHSLITNFINLGYWCLPHTEAGC